MNTKEQVLQFLEENRGIHVSGTDIAEQLGVSRTAVWKSIRKLREEGLTIEAATNRGYRLAGSQDPLTKQGVASYLTRVNPEHLEVHREIDSTNNRAKALAVEGAPHGTLIIADAQTQGRGRLGRNFLSPSGSGIYMSLIIRPETDLSEALLITTATAVAAVRAIRKLTGEEAGIKWVNDVYLGEKKICGILTEAVTNFETGLVESVVVGIGINCIRPAWPDTMENPPEIPDKMGWIFDPETNPPTVSRNQLAAAIADEILFLCEDLRNPSILEEYRTYSIMLGKKITCIRGQERFQARALDINEQGGLMIRLPDGTETVLLSGEISIRW